MPTLSSVGFIGRIGGAISSAVATALTYLLRSSLSGTQALADGDILAPGKGNIHIGETGSGTVDISSNRLRLTGGATGAWNVLGAYVEPPVNTAAGKIYITPGSSSVDTDATTAVQLNNDADFTQANREILFSFATGVLRVKFEGGGDYTLADTYVNGTIYPLATITGGFTSGAPDSSGVEGGMAFYHDGTNWVLMAPDTKTFASPLYPAWQVWDDASPEARCLINEFFVPTDTTLGKTCFTPDGYALSLFNASNGTAITSYTADSGQAWTYLLGSGNDLEIQGNVATCSVTLSNKIAVMATGLADMWLQASTVANAGTNGDYPHLVFRATDDDNKWQTRRYNYTGFDTFELSKRVAGSFTTVSTAYTATGSKVMAVRCSGSSVEAWVDGGNKLSQSDSFNSTVENHGFSIYNGANSGAAGATIENWYCLPLTSTTYDTALATDELTADDCEIYQTFSDIDDQTLSDGTVLYGGQMTNGSGVVVGSTTSINNGNLETVNPTSGDQYSHLTYFDARTPAAGSVVKYEFNPSQITDMQEEFGVADATSSFSTNRLMRFLAQDATGADYELRTHTGAGGNLATYQVDGVSAVAAGSNGVAISFGGFTSGTPDSAGTGGCRLYGKPSGASDWELVAVDANTDYAQTMYPYVCAFTLTTLTVDRPTIEWPDATYATELFEPSGSTIDTFTYSNSDLTGNGAWETIPAGGVSFAFSGNSLIVLSNVIQQFEQNAFHGNVIDTSESDIWMQFSCSDGSASVPGRLVYCVFRYSDEKNFFTCRQSTASSVDWALDRIELDSSTRLGSTSTSTAAATSYQARASGQDIAVWKAGGDKLAPVSAQTFNEFATKCGFIAHKATGASGNIDIDNFMVLPLTDAGVTTTLDSI